MSDVPADAGTGPRFGPVFVPPVDPHLDAATIVAVEDGAELPTYVKLPVVITRGAGVMLYDVDGREYYDFYSGHAVAVTGHCHPQVVKALCDQAGRLIFYSNVVYNDTRAVYAAALMKVAPQSFGRVFFCNSGAEANETALKMARKYTGRSRMVAMEGSFHGRTAGALSVTHNRKYSAGFGIGPLESLVSFVPFGSAAAVAAAVGPDTAAVVIEPIQSIAGVRMAPPRYYQELRQICDAAGALLIFDEAQTAFGRTGKMWAGEHWEVIPDVITLSKGIASGVPMGATLVNTRIGDTVQVEEHGSTFGGSPLACAAAAATLEVVIAEDLTGRAVRLGALVRERLTGLPHLVEIRGLGLLLGLRFDVPGKIVQDALLGRGIILGTSADLSVLRLMPPLVVEDAHIEHLARTLREVLGGL
ncbi:MAG TPA: aminotransferase class III-fold pyridoxal phosphate-dependent enzyme [Chloroflexia bacterium]|nr:aminotransferase class III-fold pyridoxal phosphate-dependent enzyme [Chloroflexia bacterium]